MEVGKGVKAISVVLFIIELIGFIAVSVKDVDGYYFDWRLFLPCILFALAFSVIIFALGEIIEQLDCSNNNTYSIHDSMKK